MEGGFTHSDVYNMPVYLRTFYYKKLVDAKKKEKNPRWNGKQMITNPAQKNVFYLRETLVSKHDSRAWPHDSCDRGPC